MVSSGARVEGVKSASGWRRAAVFSRTGPGLDGSIALRDRDRGYFNPGHAVVAGDAELFGCGSTDVNGPAPRERAVIFDRHRRGLAGFKVCHFGNGPEGQ